MVDRMVHSATRLLVWLDGVPRRTIVAVLLVFAGAMIALTFDPRVSRGGDNALYFALARSLADTGTYRNLVTPGAPFETSVPWGYPLALSVGMRLFDASYGVLTIVSTLSMLIAVLAIFLLIEVDGRGIAFLVGVLVSLNDHVIDYASKLLTEAPYMATSFVALAIATRRRGSGVTAIVAALVAVSYLILQIGIALVVALFAWLAVHRRWRDLAVSTPIVLAIAGSWHLRNLLVPRDGENLYVHYFFKQSKYQTNSATVDALGLVSRFFHNATAYTFDVLSKISIGEHDVWVVGAILAALIVAGYRASLRRLELAHFYLPLELGLLFLWLPESVDVRYLVVLFPLLVWFAFLGAGAVAERLRPGAKALGIVALFACLAGISVERLTWILPRLHGIQEQILAGDPLAGKPPADLSFVELCTWLRDHADPDAVIASRKSRLVWYWSGRPAIDLPATAVPDEVIAFLAEHEVAYVVVDSLPTTSGRTRKRLEDAISTRPEHFTTLYTTEHGDSIVRFVP